MSPRAAWPAILTACLLAWAAVILAVTLTTGAHPMTVLAWLGATFAVVAVLSWPASAALVWLAARRRTRARRRVNAWLDEAELTRQREELERLAVAADAAIRAAQADALARALDGAELYGVHAPTAVLPAAIDDAAYYPPSLTRRPRPHPIDAAGLDRSIARHPASQRAAKVVPFPTGPQA